MALLILGFGILPILANSWEIPMTLLILAFVILSILANSKGNTLDPSYISVWNSFYSCCSNSSLPEI